MATVTIQKKIILKTIKFVFWFTIGTILGFFLFVSFVVIIFQRANQNVAYPGISINGIDVSSKTEQHIKDLFLNKNNKIGNTKFVFLSDEYVATVSASELKLGYDQNTLAKQAISIGRGKNILSNISLIIQAYMNGINLPPLYHYSEDKLLSSLSPIIDKIGVDPIDALFTFQNGKVTAFRLSQDGQAVDIDRLKNHIGAKIPTVISPQKALVLTFQIPISVLKPKVTTEQANSLGLKELLGEGTSFFQHSIPNRIYNITLAATRLNGILVAPDEIFSFNKALGDISSFTGYKQAYIIQNGKTILGDGGGVCQVSTTLFRAILKAGFPIVERHAHAYRVGYYEQDSLPGFDATIYVPSVDLKFKNETGNYILIQTSINPNTQQLNFSLYGTTDGREVTINKPAIANLTPAPADEYQDDPSIQKGTIRQIDYKADGASVYFTRQVTKNGKTIISDKFVSNYIPWKAVYLRGTKE